MADLAEAIKQLAKQQNDGTYPTSVLFGVIVDTDPLSLQIGKNVYTSEFLVVAEHLTKKQYTAEISVSDASGTTSVVSTHSHSVLSLESENVTLTIDNSLKKDDKVLIVQQQGGQKFAIIDRIGG